MVKKMKFVNIMGPTKDIERVRERYISKYEIQIEDAVKEMGQTNKEISFYSVANPLINAMKSIEKIADSAKVDETFTDKEITREEALKVIESISAIIDGFFAKTQQLQAERNRLETTSNELTPFVNLDFYLEKLYNFNFIKYRFGRIPISGYKQFEAYLYSNDALLFQKSHTDREYVWGIYFVPRTMYEKVDAIFASLYFERVEISDGLKGRPVEAYEDMHKRIEEIDTEIDGIEQEQYTLLNDKREDISAALKKIKADYNFFEMQKYIAKTKDDFYIIVGWMAENDAKALEEEAKNDPDVTVIVKNESPNIRSKPPTRLSNLPFFRPFEFFVKMYGLPAYNEIDPTPFFGITYTILFGIMFGDLGQGIALSLFGFWYYKYKKSPVGAILAIVGISSAFFGALYGSIFGYENVFEPLWIRPLENMADILIATVGFGIGLNLCAMIIQIINAIKRKDYGSLLFSSNGISGILFYTIAIGIGLSMYFGIDILPVWAIELMVGLPLLFIMLREPLSNLIKRKKKLIHGSLSEYLMEMLFETFEIILSFVTNTISFVRVGAFALCHAGMMSVVLMLAGVSHESSGNAIIMIIGNLFVMGLEGLIVSIQVLRLQYYEMFSRFFKGDGKAFKSFTSH